MEYEGQICRGPMERGSYMLPTSVGCSYNACRFCMLFKHLKYRELPLEQIEGDLVRVKKAGGKPKRVFLGDGNAFCTDPERLKSILRLVRQYFPTTRYEGFQLPAGQYQALRVELGQAEGRNWWCVLYPGLCLAASSLPAGYGDTAEQGLVVGEYEIRFALLELWQRTACRDIPAAGGIG